MNNMNSVPMNISISTGSMDGSPMISTFSSWNSYQLQLLFVTWQITQPWQFALSWLAVASTAVVYHGLECVIHSFETEMARLLATKYQLIVAVPVPEGEGSSDTDYSAKSQTAIAGQGLIPRPVGWQLVKLIQSFLLAVRYGLGLMLMLVVMSFNPNLFLAVVIGYMVGGCLFSDYKMDRAVFSTMPGDHREHKCDVFAAFIIRCILLIPSSSSDYETNNDDLKAAQISSSARFAQWFLWGAPRVTSLTFLIVLLAWIVQVEGGFGFDFMSVFGWHAFFMSCFVLMFTNEAMLTYAAPLFPQLRNSRNYLRYWHSFCHTLALTSIILGMVAIVAYKRWAPHPIVFPFWTMWSAHSWLGCFTLSLWFVQLCYSGWLYGVAKWADTPSGQARKEFYVNIHHLLGHCVFATGLATCATGFVDMQSSDIAGADAAYLVAMNTTVANVVMGGDGGTTSGGVNDDSLFDGYLPHSYFAQLASAGTILLFMSGMSTYATLKFMPLTKPGALAEASAVAASAEEASLKDDDNASANGNVSASAGANGNSSWHVAGGYDLEIAPTEKAYAIDGDFIGDSTGNSDNDSAESAKLPLSFPVVVVLWWLPRVISGIFFIVLLLWIFSVEGGLGFNELSIFGWHALLMSGFTVLFTNEAVLTFVAPLLPQLGTSRDPDRRKRHLGYLHSVCHILGIACVAMGMVAIVDYKKWFVAPPVVFPFWSMWSAHSWLGAMTLVCWALQFLGTFIHRTLVATGCISDPATKHLLQALHRFLGHSVYAMALASCATGLQDMQSSDLATADAAYLVGNVTMPAIMMGMTGTGMQTTLRSDGLNDDFLYEGYKANSKYSHYAGALCLLLFFLGMSTYAALKLLPTRLK